MKVVSPECIIGVILVLLLGIVLGAGPLHNCVIPTDTAAHAAPPVHREVDPEAAVQPVLPANAVLYMARQRDGRLKYWQTKVDRAAPYGPSEGWAVAESNLAIADAIWGVGIELVGAYRDAHPPQPPLVEAPAE